MGFHFRSKTDILYSLRLSVLLLACNCLLPFLGAFLRKRHEKEEKRSKTGDNGCLGVLQETVKIAFTLFPINYCCFAFLLGSMLCSCYLAD